MTGNISSCTRRYLSWIEDLTTNQGVIGSNPIRRTTQIKGLPSGSPFLCRFDYVERVGADVSAIRMRRSYRTGRRAASSFESTHENS